MTIDIRLCDARVGLMSLADESIDMIFTDPPYPTISGGKGVPGDGSPSGILSENDGRVFKHNDIDISSYAGELYRVLKSPGHCYIMCNLVNLWRFHEVLTNVGFKVHNLLIWKKNNSVVNRWGHKNCEYILFLRKGPARPLYENFPTVIEVKNVRRSKKTHPTEKPVGLVDTLIKGSSRVGETILDPFCGTGSTVEAARLNQRNTVAFEIDTEYYNIACKRLGVLPGYSGLPGQSHD